MSHIYFSSPQIAALRQAQAEALAFLNGPAQVVFPHPWPEDCETPTVILETNQIHSDPHDELSDLVDWTVSEADLQRCTTEVIVRIKHTIEAIPHAWRPRSEQDTMLKIKMSIINKKMGDVEHMLNTTAITLESFHALHAHHVAIMIAVNVIRHMINTTQVPFEEVETSSISGISTNHASTSPQTYSNINVSASIPESYDSETANTIIRTILDLPTGNDKMFTIEKQDQCIEFFLSLREGTPAHQFKMLEALSSTSKLTTESLRKDVLSVNHDVLIGDLTQYGEKYRIGTLMTTNAHQEQLDSTAISNAPKSLPQLQTSDSAILSKQFKDKYEAAIETLRQHALILHRASSATFTEPIIAGCTATTLSSHDEHIFIQLREKIILSIYLHSYHCTTHMF